MNSCLTDKQQQVYSFIVNYCNEHNYVPTMREIAANFCVSVSTVSGHIDALIKKNFLHKERPNSHSFCINKDIKQNRMIPLFFSLSDDSIEEQLNYCSEFIKFFIDKNNYEEKYFAIKIDNDLLNKCGILKNDIAIIKLSEIPKDGDIILTKLTDSGKYHFKIYGKAHNRCFLKDICDSEQIQYIQKIKCEGILKNILRNYE